MIFGVFTDLHYSDKKNDEVRFFQNAPEKLERCIQFFKEKKVDFMICLGDLLDYGREKQKERMQELQEIIEKSNIPFYLCLGNHDIDAFSYRVIWKQFMPHEDKSYYSFNKEEFHFIVLDTNYDYYGQHYLEQTMIWDQLYINDEQLQWVKNDLRNTNKKTIIFTHGNLDVRKIDGYMDPHIIKNSEAVRRVIEENGRVLAVIQGHCHAGAFSIQNGITYITLKALIDGRESTPILLGQTMDDSTLEIQFYNIATMKEDNADSRILLV